jgi:hypothetical protein
MQLKKQKWGKVSIPRHTANELLGEFSRNGNGKAFTVRPNNLNLVQFCYESPEVAHRVAAAA